MEGRPGTRVLTPSDMLPLKDSESSEEELPLSWSLQGASFLGKEVGAAVVRRNFWYCLRTVDFKRVHQITWRHLLEMQTPGSCNL